MKNLAWLFSIIVLASAPCFAQTSAFTYQGKLASSGAPATGDFQFEFKLFNDNLAGTQIGTTQGGVVTVTGGAFSTRLDFGPSAFPADADRWLEISVRPPGSADPDPYTVLTPRQQINSVPFAVRSLKATDADNATTANTATTAGNVSGVVAVSNGGTGSTTQNFVDLSTTQTDIGGDKKFAGTLSGNGSGLTNLNGANLSAGSVNAQQLGDLSVTSSALADDSVKTSKIAEQSVTTGKLADGSVTAAKLAPDVNATYTIDNFNGVPLPNNSQSASVVHLNLPTGTYLLLATVRFANTGVSNTVGCHFSGESNFGFFIASNTPDELVSYHSVLNITSGGVDLVCSGTGISADRSRLTAVKIVGNVTVQ